MSAIYPDRQYPGLIGKVRDPAPTGREAGNLPQPEEVAARPVASPPGGPRLFLNAQELYDRAMELTGFDPAAAKALIAAEWTMSETAVVLAALFCDRQARVVKSQTTSS